MARAKRVKKPKHTVEVRSYDFPIDCAGGDSDLLFSALRTCHGVRNQLAIERRDNRAAVRDNASVAFLTKKDQYQRLKQLAQDDAAVGALHSQVLQNIADRIDHGTKRWFDAMAEGRHHVRPPGPIEFKRYNSFTYPQYGNGAKLVRGELHLSKLGAFRLVAYRKIRGKKKSVTIKFKHGRWWAIFTAEIQAADLYDRPQDVANRPDIGVDPGLTKVLNDSAGHQYATPRPLRAAQKALKREQRAMSRKFEARKSTHAALKVGCQAANEPVPPLREMPYSNRLKRQIRRVAKLHTKVFRVRGHGQKKNAAIFGKCYRNVAIEEHGVQFMIRNRRQAKAASDVAIASQKHALRSRLGPRYVPAGTSRAGIGGNSQTCLCGEPVPKTLKERWHSCPACGIEGDRDWIASNIVEHQAFGTVNESLERACGQQVLERALALLRTRGGGEVLRGATRPGRKSTSVESPVKRAPQATGKSRHTAGGEPTAEGKTGRHREGRIPPKRCRSAPKPSIAT